MIIRLVNPANLWVVFLLYAIAMLVGITRLYVEAYYPRDVLAEAILDIIDARPLIEDNYPSGRSQKFDSSIEWSPPAI